MTRRTLTSLLAMLLMAAAARADDAPKALTAEQIAKGKLHVLSAQNVQLETQARIQSLPEVQAIQTEARKKLVDLQRAEQALEAEFVKALGCADGWDWQAMACAKKPELPQAASQPANPK